MGHVGATGAIELTAIAGFYSTIEMLIVAFEVDLPQGVARPFPSLGKATHVDVGHQTDPGKTGHNGRAAVAHEG